MTINDNTETPVIDEAPSKFAALKTRLSQLPLKKIAIAAAVTTAAAIVIANKDKYGEHQSFEVVDIEILEDGSAVAEITPIND